MKNRTTLLAGILALVIIAAGIGTYFMIRPASASGAVATQLTTVVQQGTVSSTVTASGFVEPVRTVNVPFGVSGTIATVNVAVGTTVTAGQQLGTLDPTTLNLNLAAAYTALANARSDLAGAETVLAELEAAPTPSPSPSPGGNAAPNAASATQNLNNAQSQVNADQVKVSSDISAVYQAQANLAAATLKSPIAGLVIAVSGQVGGNATAGSPTTSTGTSVSNSSFITIANISQMTVTANIAEADIASVTVGQVANVTFPALNGVKATAKVTAISPTATASNAVVTYATTITLDSIPTGLRLGQTADVTITTKSSAATALYVPSAAIKTAADGTSTVEVVGTNGKNTTVTVTLGVVGDQGTEIRSGLKLGQTVVLGTVSATSGTTTGTGAGRPGRGGGLGGLVKNGLIPGGQP